MKIEPGFVSHWKTERLLHACGPSAVLGLLRLWGDAQTRRCWTGLTLSPRKLASIMKWDGDADVLWTAMTDPDGPWLDPEPAGTWTLHGFEEHNRQLIHLWHARRKGGAPSPIPPSHNNNTDRTGLDPNEDHLKFICRSNDLHMDLHLNGKKPATSVQTPDLQEFKTAASMIGVSESIAEEIWHDNESRPIAPTGEWTDIYGNPIRNWRSNMKARAAQIERKRPSTLSTKPMSVWEATQKKNALQAELERMKGDRRWRKAKAETPWETEWTAEGREKARGIREKIAKLEEVITK